LIQQIQTPAPGKPQILVLGSNSASKYSTKDQYLAVPSTNSGGMSSKITCPSHSKPFNITNYKRKPVKQNHQNDGNNNPSLSCENNGSPDKGGQIGVNGGLETPCLSDSLSKDSLGPELQTILEDSLHF